MEEKRTIDEQAADRAIGKRNFQKRYGGIRYPRVRIFGRREGGYGIEVYWPKEDTFI